MKFKPCPYEDAVAAAARSGEWSAELGAHRDGCLSCAEVTLVVAALASDAKELTDRALPLPDPGLIWLRARLAARERKVKSATRWISLVQKAALASAAAVALAFAPAIWGLVSGVFSRVDIAGPALPRAAGSPILVLVGSMAVLGILALAELTSMQERR